jgi:hypothetical protein
MKERRASLRGTQDVDHSRQPLISDIDEPSSLLSGMRVTRRDGSNSVADIKHFVTSQRIITKIFEIDRSFTQPGRDILSYRQVLGRDHSVNAWQGLGAVGVDREDPRVSVRATEHFTV